MVNAPIDAIVIKRLMLILPLIRLLKPNSAIVYPERIIVETKKRSETRDGPWKYLKPRPKAMVMTETTRGIQLPSECS
jgi:hypothetical protein